MRSRALPAGGLEGHRGDGGELGDGGPLPEGPAPRGKLLELLLDAEVDLDQAFDRLVDAQRGGRESRAVLRSTLPGDTFASGEMTLAVLLASILSEYEDIERLLDGLREYEVGPDSTGAALERSGAELDGESGSEPAEDAVAVVSEAELADPATLSRVLEPLHDRRRFEVLFETAKATLDHLDVYELSRKPSAELVSVLREKGNLRTVQSLVSFLRSLNTAAATFEAMDMPRPHVREYLKHLYLMKDWEEMPRLVGVLEVAVSQMVESEVPTDPDRGGPALGEPAEGGTARPEARAGTVSSAADPRA